MMRLITMVACLVAIAQAASVKKRDDNYNGPHYEVNETTPIEASYIMGDINEAMSTYESMMRWVQDMEQSVGDRLNAGGSSPPDMSAIEGELNGIMAEYSNYMREMQRTASQLREDAMRQAGMVKRSLESAGYQVGDMPNFGNSVPDFSAMFNNGNAGERPEGMPHGVPDFSAMFNGNPGANQGSPDFSAMFNGNPGSNQGSPDFSAMFNGNPGSNQGSPDFSAMFNGNPGANQGSPDFSAMFNGNPGANQGSPDFSSLSHNTNPATNPELAQTIENFNKEMEKQMKAIGEEMMRNLERLGLNPEFQRGKR